LILYLTYDGLTDPLGQSQILPYLEGLSKLGHEITVISFEKGNAYLSDSIGSLDSQGKMKVIPLKYHKSPPVLSTIFDIYHLKKEVMKIIKSQKIDIIHCRSYITSLVGLWAKRKFGIPFIFDMRGFWPDERVEGKLWNLSNPLFEWIYKFFKKKELEYLSESDAIISLTHNAKNEILTWDKVKLSAKKVHVIPTCANFDLFDPKSIGADDVAAVRSELGIKKDDFILLYLGSLGTWYMLDEMLDFFEELKIVKSKQNISCKFLFVTRDKGVLQNALSKRNLSDQDIIITQSTRENVPIYICLCNVGVFFILPTFSKKASSATKMGELMAMGKPVMTNTGWGDVDTILGNSRDGVLVSRLDAMGYQQAIDELEKLSFDPRLIRKDAGKHFSLQNGIQIYDEIYYQLGTNTHN